MGTIKLTDQEFKRITDYVHSNYGINLSQKRVLIEGRLSNLITEEGFSNFTDYLNNIFSDSSGRKIVAFVNKVTTNHTFFWREPRHFEYLMEVVMPWIEQNIHDKDARIWCAASSSGEEPYNLCMCIDQYFGMKAADWDLRILASDIDTDILEKARKAEYSYESVKALPPEYLKKYFKQTSSQTYQVIDRIKKQVIFRQFNLMDRIEYKKPYHLISCRNVMIYFEQATKNALVERFYDVMAPGGFLFIGHAESVSKTSRYSYVEPAIYRKIPR
jgi:chemotaxis protein methyltransferase CheR